MKSVAKAVLTFLVHQCIGMYGIPFTAPVVFSLAFKFPQSHSRTFYSIVSELPYFPVQIIFGLILGWLLGRALRHRSITWVWVIPLAILCYSVVTATVLTPTSVFASPGAGQTRFSHYFGWGCRPADRCLDQLLITMPFYSSLAYSLGAALARRTFGYAKSENKKHYRAVAIAGVIVFAAFVIDLIVSTRQRGWHSTYLLIGATPLAISALLLYVGVVLRRQPASTT